jgi:hypothetical protein
MITESYKKDQLLKDWYNFRQRLELSNNPLEDTANFFLAKPRVKFYTDPYDRSTWPTPWELITENEFCQINIILGICYTLQLTDRFKHLKPTFTISVDNCNKNVYYLLYIDNLVFGYDYPNWIESSELPKNLSVQKIITMEPVH